MTFDTFMHCVMAIVTLAVLMACQSVIGILPSLAIACAWATLLREVTQRQSKHFHDDFRRGWDVWNWTSGKRIETFVPMALVLAIGFLPGAFHVALH